MSLRIFLSSFSKAFGHYPRSARSASSTTKKIEELAQVKKWTNEEIIKHDKKIPTLEQIQKDPLLLEELRRQYEEAAKDPEWMVEQIELVEENRRLQFYEKK